MLFFFYFAARIFLHAFVFPIKVQSRDIYVYASFPARSAAVPFPRLCHCRSPLAAGLDSVMDAQIDTHASRDFFYWPYMPLPRASLMPLTFQ